MCGAASGMRRGLNAAVADRQPRARGIPFPPFFAGLPFFILLLEDVMGHQ